MNDDKRWTDEREVRIEAAPQVVWEAWALPDQVRRWFSDDAHGELTPGSELVHVFHGHGEHRYRVVQAEAPRRLVLEGDMDGLAFRQETVIRRDGGTTVLRLVHSGFGTVDPESEVTRGIDSGWTMALALLKHYAEEYFGREKVAMSLFRPARFEYETLLRGRYLSAAGLRSWLAEDASDIAPGGVVHLRLPSGRTLTGRPLAITDHEVSLSWEELEGVLELKAFGTGPAERVLGVRVTAWRAEPGEMEEIRRELAGAVERLLASNL